MRSPVIATVEAADNAALAALHALGFERPWSLEALADTLVSPGVFALKAGTPPMGFLLARTVIDEAEILTLTVDPAARRTGLGRALVEAAAFRAQSAGVASLWLEVAQDNVAALTLYVGCGFEQVGRRKGYYPRHQGLVDALTLKRRLNSAPA